MGRHIGKNSNSESYEGIFWLETIGIGEGDCQCDGSDDGNDPDNPNLARYNRH